MSSSSEKHVHHNTLAFTQTELSFWADNITLYLETLFLRLSPCLEGFKCKLEKLISKWFALAALLANKCIPSKCLVNRFNVLVAATKHVLLAIQRKETQNSFNTPENARAWIGAIYPSELTWILRQLVYASAVSRCFKLKKCDHVKFWRKTLEGTALIVQQSLDPCQWKLIKQLHHLAEKIHHTKDVKCLYKLAGCEERVIRFILCCVKRNTLLTILHPKWVEAALRLAQRARRVLHKLKKHCDVRPGYCSSTSSISASSIPSLSSCPSLSSSSSSSSCSSSSSSCSSSSSSSCSSSSSSTSSTSISFDSFKKPHCKKYRDCHN